MPTKPRTFRPHGAPSPTVARQQYDRERSDLNETRHLYRTSRWQRLRLNQLAEEPLCKFCLEDGVVTSANVCDHVEAHRGDVVKFWSGPFQSLCTPCHSSRKQALESGGSSSPR